MHVYSVFFWWFVSIGSFRRRSIHTFVYTYDKFTSIDRYIYRQIYTHIFRFIYRYIIYVNIYEYVYMMTDVYRYTVHIHRHIHICSHIYTDVSYMYIHIHIYTFTCVWWQIYEKCIHIYTQIYHIFTYIYIHIYTMTNIYTYIHIYIQIYHIFTYIYMYAYMMTNIHRSTDLRRKGLIHTNARNTLACARRLMPLHVSEHTHEQVPCVHSVLPRNMAFASCLCILFSKNWDQGRAKKEKSTFKVESSFVCSA